MAMPDVRMSVARIEYASPGSMDLLGVGKVCEVVCNMISRIVVLNRPGFFRRLF